MGNTITFWEPEQKTFYYLNLKTLRSLIAWGYDLTNEQTERVGYDLGNGEYWSSIQTTKIDEEQREYYRSELLVGCISPWDILLDDLASQGKIPPGDYLLSVY